MSAVDDVFESWEEMEESGALDKRLNSLKINVLDNLEDMESPRLTVSNNTSARMIILGEDSMRSQYVPPEPTVKILKRPVRNLQDGVDGPMNGEKPKQPIKSLKQREREYAEARKRILGEERSPEERALEQVNAIQAKLTTTTMTMTTMTSPTSNNVVRMPTGPDGTRGFNVRR